VEEQALSVTLEALRKNQCIAILDLKSREVELSFYSQQLLSFLSV
jgi:hypothetical protein